MNSRHVGSQGKTNYKNISEVLSMEIEHVLDQISFAFADQCIPVLKVIKRNSEAAITFTNDAILLNTRQIKVMDLRFGTERFQIYKNILKDILDGLMSDSTTKKR